MNFIYDIIYWQNLILDYGVSQQQCEHPLEAPFLPRPGESYLLAKPEATEPEPALEFLESRIGQVEYLGV